MSILTKIFVVLVTILSVTLVAVIVPFAAKTDDYAKKWSESDVRAALAEKAATEAQRTLTQQVTAKDAANSALTLDNAKLRESITALQAEITAKSLDLQSEKGSSAANTAELKRLASTLQQATSILEAQKAELDIRRDEAVKQQTRLVQLVDHNNELEGQLEILNRQVKRFNEQLTALEEQKAKLQEELAQSNAATKTQTASQEPFEPSVKISGQVTAVEKVNSTTYVQINIGIADGVAPNMKFYIHRNGVFLGTLVVAAVDAKASSGRIILAQQDIQAGDQVLTGSGTN